MGRKSVELVVDLEEAAKRLLTKPSTIRREIREGKLKAVKLGGKLIVRVVELENYLLRKEDEGMPQVPRGRRRNALVEIEEWSASKDKLPSIFTLEELREARVSMQEEARSQGE
ncbi:MAG: helix-turn-helix domain-containing protein [Planctomycetota bacterium]|nr:helix-turn-helix domain-containing protein [Planctomycetota bacterium]